MSYGSLIANIAWMDLRLLFSQRDREGTKIYVIGIAMQVQIKYSSPRTSFRASFLNMAFFK